MSGRILRSPTSYPSRRCYHTMLSLSLSLSSASILLIQTAKVRRENTRHRNKTPRLASTVQYTKQSSIATLYWYSKAAY